MEWVNEFYTRQSSWLGAPQIFDYDRDRVAAMERLAGGGSKRVLELGAGDGTTAAALAEAGHTVVAVELSAVRAANARQLAGTIPGDLVTVVDGDFFEVQLDGRFDVVACWDGFGTGSDANQRRLLRRIAAEWLAPGGCVVMDIYHPVKQILAAGEEEFYDESRGIKRFYDFNPVSGRFIDRWWPAEQPDQLITQSLRCYTPADLLLLLEGTGLMLERTEAEGERLDLSAGEHTMAHPLGQFWSYLVKLVATDNGQLP